MSLGLDSATGVLTLDEYGAAIGPTLTRDAFCRSPIGLSAKPEGKNEPHSSWKLPPCRSAGMPLAGIIYFDDERLAMVSLANNDPKLGTSWDDWSEEKELQRKQSHDDWLQRQIGAERQFPWGEIWSGYDPRSGGSSIVIRYHAKQGRPTLISRLAAWLGFGK